MAPARKDHIQHPDTSYGQAIFGLTAQGAPLRAGEIAGAGTSMSFPGRKDETRRRAIVEYVIGLRVD